MGLVLIGTSKPLQGCIRGIRPCCMRRCLCNATIPTGTSQIAKDNISSKTNPQATDYSTYLEKARKSLAEKLLQQHKNRSNAPLNHKNKRNSNRTSNSINDDNHNDANHINPIESDFPSQSNAEQLRSVKIPKDLIYKLEALQLRRRQRPLSTKEKTGHSRYGNQIEKEEVPLIFRTKSYREGQTDNVDEFPVLGLPEIAFAGRSNVGKSTFLNKIMGRWNVAHVENKPGVTQELHFYRLGKKLVLVDLPGYGFAYAGVERRGTWVKAMHEYLRTRSNLKRIIILLDARHGIKAADEIFMDALDTYKVKYQVVLTKCDMVETTELARRITLVKEAIQFRRKALDYVTPVSRFSELSLNLLRKDMLFLADNTARKSTLPSYANASEY